MEPIPAGGNFGESIMRIYKSVDELIGGTPIVELSRIEKKYGLRARLLAKLEAFNPAGSVKDRVARAIIEDAERTGRLAPGATIFEPTSGNTGIGIAAVAAARGYRAVIVMPDSMSAERRSMIRAYGAEIVLTPGAEGMPGAIRKAEELQRATPGSIVAGQFVNPANPRAHYEGTGPEIFSDTDGTVDWFVAGAGTGGTVSGAGRYLKERKPSVKVVAVEPDGSPVISGGKAGPHKLQGIGAGFIPETLDRSVIDEVIRVADQDAFDTGRELAHTEAIMSGISAGAALWAAIQVAGRPEAEGKTVVVLLPDSGDRYLSTPLYAEPKG